MTTSLDSVTNKLSRDRLFFDQYRYGMRFKFYNSGRMRNLDRQAILTSIQWVNSIASLRRVGAITDERKQMLFQMADAIESIELPFKRIVYTDWQYFYTNHPEIFKCLEQVPGVHNVSYTEAVVDQPRDTVTVKHSDYQWRTYFREKFYTRDQIQILSSFILSRPEQFRTTDLWRKRLPQLNCYITRSFFVDHHDQKDVLLLQMAMPGSVRKTVPILSRE